MRLPRGGAAGLAYALAGMLAWGLSPLYWARLRQVPVPHILLHRIVWSAVFLLLWLARRGRLGELAAAFRPSRTLATLAATTACIATNWYLYIWGVTTGRVLETSLGYFILPLVIVLLGRVALGERLRLLQKLAVALASAAVLIPLLRLGRFPWLALTLAVTFAAYALLRKTAAVDALIGLSVETCALAAPAAAILAWRAASGVYWPKDASTAALLLGSFTMTAVPLLWYTEGARRLSLKTLGFLQYLSPSCQFLLGILYFREPLSRSLVLTFAVIWAALALYTVDAARHAFRQPLQEELI